MTDAAIYSAADMFDDTGGRVMFGHDYPEAYDPGPDDNPTADDAYEAALRATRELKEATRREVIRQRACRAARKVLDAEDAAACTLPADLLDVTELAQLPHPEPLIEGVLDRHVYAVLRGRDSTYKTFAALAWALSLATGTPWEGRRAERVNVLYIAAEGAYGIHKRVQAWEEHTGVTVPPGAFTVLPRGLNLHSGVELPALLDVIRKRRVGLVVVDTLRRVSGAADGNGSDMGAVVDNLDEIRRATADGSVLVVAHTGKSDSDTRGFSGVEDDADTVWHAARDRDDQTVALTLVKAKDGPDGARVTLRPLPVAASVVLVGHTPAGGVTAGGPRETAIVDALMARRGHADPTGPQLRDESGISHTTFYAVLGGLVDRGVVAKEGTGNRVRYRLRGDDR